MVSRRLECELRVLGVRQPQLADPDRLRLLLSLYDASPVVVLDQLNRFFADRRDRLKGLYSTYCRDDRVDQCSRAPEALLLLERLEYDRDRLQDLWRKHLPIYELEQTAAFYGVPL